MFKCYTCKRRDELSICNLRSGCSWDLWSLQLDSVNDVTSFHNFMPVCAFKLFFYCGIVQIVGGKKYFAVLSKYFRHHWHTKMLLYLRNEHKKEYRKQCLLEVKNGYDIFTCESKQVWIQIEQENKIILNFFIKLRLQSVTRSSATLYIVHSLSNNERPPKRARQVIRRNC